MMIKKPNQEQVNEEVSEEDVNESFGIVVNSKRALGFSLEPMKEGKSYIFVGSYEECHIEMAQILTKKLEKMKYSFLEYQQSAYITGIKDQKRLDYLALGFMSEASELIDNLKRKYRSEFDDYDVEAIASELGNIIWYIAQIATEFNLNLYDVALNSAKKIEATNKDYK